MQVIGTCEGLEKKGMCVFNWEVVHNNKSAVSKCNAQESHKGEQSQNLHGLSGDEKLSTTPQSRHACKGNPAQAKILARFFLARTYVSKTLLIEDFFFSVAYFMLIII